MDLLLVVQDFLVAWHKGKREEVQAVTTASFGKLLGELPTTHLERLTKKVAGERIKAEEFRPEATIDGQDAIVKLQRARGILILSMRLTNKGWKVADVQVESRKDKDQLASAKRTATVIRTVVDFLKSYQGVRQAQLKKLSAPTFYEKCLVLADPKLVPLPTAGSSGRKGHGDDAGIDGRISPAPRRRHREDLAQSPVQRRREFQADRGPRESEVPGRRSDHLRFQVGKAARRPVHRPGQDAALRPGAAQGQPVAGPCQLQQGL